MHIIRTENLNFKNIIRYPDIAIDRGEATFIAGDSGSGKSTLLKLLNGTQSSLEGNIYYDGKNILDMDTIELRRKALLVSQSVFLFDKTIRENFEEFYSYRQETPPPGDCILEYLNLCKADFSLDANCSNMSGGERQRVYIAIYLSFHPEVLMLDEPTSALDTNTARGLFTNIKEYAKEKGMSLVAISHDRQIVEEFSDKTIYLQAGGDA